MAMDIPPWTWASARAGFMSVPQSWIFTSRRRVTLHMGMSTSTSAKEQPKE